MFNFFLISFQIFLEIFLKVQSKLFKKRWQSEGYAKISGNNLNFLQKLLIVLWHQKRIKFWSHNMGPFTHDVRKDLDFLTPRCCHKIWIKSIWLSQNLESPLSPTPLPPIPPKLSTSSVNDPYQKMLNLSKILTSKWLKLAKFLCFWQQKGQKIVKFLHLWSLGNIWGIKTKNIKNKK